MCITKRIINMFKQTPNHNQDIGKGGVLFSQYGGGSIYVKEMLATTSADDNVYVYREPNDGLQQTLTGHNQQTEVAKFSPNNDYLAVGASGGGGIVYETNTWTQTDTFGSGVIISLDWAPSGDYLAYERSANAEFRVAETVNWTDSHIEGGATYTVVNYGPNGNVLAAGINNGDVEVFNTGTWTTQTTFSNNNSDVYGIHYSQNGDYIAYTTDNGNLFVQETSGYTQVTNKSINVTDIPWRPVFSPSDDYLAVGDGTDLVIYETNNWTTVQTINPGQYVQEPSWSSTQQLIAFQSGLDYVEIRDVSDWSVVSTLKDANDDIIGIDFEN